MEMIVESLRRLYTNSFLTDEQKKEVKKSTDRLLQSKKITNKEYDYILGKDGE